jgi:hypothetical protein
MDSLNKKLAKGSMKNFRSNTTYKSLKVNNQGAYTVLKDDARLIESCVDEQLDWLNSKKVQTGVYLNRDCEDLPVYGPKAPIEKVFSRVEEGTKQSGARIVLTKDNYGNRTTGVGGAGGTMCEAIDIVAGSLSCEGSIRTSKTESRANFVSDGARIYLTERGDIQEYFAIGDGAKATSISSRMKSGIGIKSDHTLIIGRERVRITVGFAQAHGVQRLVNYNSQITPRIEISRIGDTGAQPAVLGHNLQKYLRKQSEDMQTLRNRIQDLENKLVRYKTAMALHTHNAAGIGYVQVFPSPEAAQNGAKSIPDFLETTVKNIIETYRQTLRDIRTFGTQDGVLKGANEDALLSNTVYIGT